MTIRYVAVEPGVHALPDGSVVEAGRLSSRSPSGDDFMQFNGLPPGKQRWGSHSFSGSFSGTPALVAAIQTANNETSDSTDEPSDPWLTTAIDRVDASGFNYALERSEVFDRANGSNYRFDSLDKPEAIGYVAFSAMVNGQFTATDNSVVNYESRFLATAADGWDNGCDAIAFNTSFSEAPIAVATKNSRREEDGGWLRECWRTSNAIRLTIDEDRSQDPERNHLGEAAGLLAFSEPFTFDEEISLGPNPLVTYRMEEEEWTGNSGEIEDATGNGHNGTAEGSADTGITSPDPAIGGDPGTCRYGNLARSGDYIVDGDAGGYLNGLSQLTVMAWVRNTGGTSVDAGILNTGPTDNKDNRLGLRYDASGAGTGNTALIKASLNTDQCDGASDCIQVETESGTQSQNEWQHVALTWQSGDRIRIYIDGEEVATTLVEGEGNLGGVLDDVDFLRIGQSAKGGEDWQGQVDEFRMFGSALSESEIQEKKDLTFPCDALLDSFEIDVAEAASVCEPEPVTVTALDANGDVVSNYTGTAALSTSSSSGNWALESGQGTLSPDPHQANDGAANYSFVEADNGSVSLTLANETADSLTITATDANGGQAGTSDPVQFQENAFLITSDDSLGSDFVAGRDHDLMVKAIGRPDSASDSCTQLSEYDGNIDLKGWIERSADDPEGDSPDLDGVSTDSMPNSKPATNNVTLAFSNGVASPQWLTSDVGQYELKLEDDSSGIVVDENGDPIPVMGVGQQWTVRPFGFDVSVAGNPGASSAGGDPFQTAGRSFDIAIRAVAHSSGDDADDDGIPDNHGNNGPSGNKNLSDNPTTPAFGNGPSLNVALTGEIAAGPSGADDPGLSGASSASGFSSGQATVAARYNEVGSIAIAADIGGSYLGRSATVIGQTGFVGRFHPERFTAQSSDGSFEAQCNGFTYTGQEHSYTLEPQVRITPVGYTNSGTPPVLNNYREDWQKLTFNDVTRDYPGQDDSNGLDVSVARQAPSLVPVGNGRMDFVFGNDDYTYTKNPASKIDPFDSDLLLQVTAIDDGEAQLTSDQNPVEIHPTGVEIRYGRIRLDNVYGPENLNLTLPLRAEYWKGGRLRLNTADESTVPTLPSGEGCFQYNPWSETEGGDVRIISSDVAENPRTENPDNFPAVQEYGLGTGEPKEGNEILVRSARDPVNPDDRQSEVELLNVPDWLKPFDSDGNLQNPSATATFGVYRGHDRIIYWREVE
ncbi:LamG domain-containing protein [Salicola sp. Rm-C-2C1-2]|uniref:LamG domain-containing protein n=1 Tax=Salicola sp. Rm-C-2C1-2 TaxID=3141321 RepID=UPI0032E4E793